MSDPTPFLPETVDSVPPGPRADRGSGTADAAPETPPPSGSEPVAGASRERAATIAFGSDGAPTVVEAPASVPVIPGYEILGVLGHGGMGVVYQAREVALDRLVALKVVVAGAHASPQQLARFRAEARAEARLQHPHVVQVHSVGEHDGFPYLSLEYMDGGSLAQKVARRPQPPREAARLTYLLARATAHAHRHGVVHRDLKPANVLLSIKGARGEGRGKKECLPSPLAPRPSPLAPDFIPKIADFGLAKCLEDESGQTRSGSLLGTPAYMSPEQADGRARDTGPSADVWALGVILYELLVGRTPFQGVTMIDTLEQVRTREPVPPAQLQPKVPTDLETVCLKCLRKEPGQRYATADALAEDLRRFLAGEPVLARPVGSLERLTRWCRRNPRLAVLSAAVLLLLVVAATSTTFAVVLDARQRETNQARREAEANAELARGEQRRADENAREAFDRYQLALDALHVVIDKVHRDLKTVPGTNQVRQEILESAMGVLRPSVARKDSSRLPERSLASAHMIMGDILLEQKKIEEAIEQYNECHALLERLYRANPDSDKAAGNYSVSLGRQADMVLEHRKDPATAREMYRRAVEIQEGLLAHPPEVRELGPEEVRRITAVSHQRLGEIALRIDPDALAEAEEHFQKARDLLEQVLPAENTRANYQRLERVCYLHGTVNGRLKRPAAALRAYDRCLDVRKKLVADNPTDARCRLDLLGLCGGVGDQYLFNGDTATALRYYREAIRPNEELAKADNRPGVRKLLGLNYYRLATAFLRSGDALASEATFRKCLDVRTRLQKEIPNDVGLRIDLMLAQARCGRYEEAAAFAAELRRRFPKEPRYLLQVACGYALAAPGVGGGKPEGELATTDRALRQHYLDTAVEALRQAKALGYNDVHNLQIEPDLDPLRQDRGFQALMREYAASLGPKK